MRSSVDLRGTSSLSEVFEGQAGEALAVAVQADSTPRKPTRKRKKRRVPFSLDLSDEQRALLDERAGAQPVGAYIRSQLFDKAQRPQRARRRPKVDHQKLALVLGMLGQSRLASNINILAEAADFGTLELSAETDEMLQTACAEILAMRQLLIEALGLQLPGDNR